MTFQVDHPLVRAAYDSDNYSVQWDTTAVPGTCAIYFASNNIYYPNSEAEFRNRILERDAYEWFGTRVAAHKHIFIRDLHKQWYLSGINARINDPVKLLAFLRAETQGCEVTTIGSSAGGFAATIFGSLLGASRVFSFNGQMEIRSLLCTSNGNTDPLVFSFKNTWRRDFYDVKPHLNTKTKVHYFYSIRSEWDLQQAAHIAETSISRVAFHTSHHGIPFLRCALPAVIAFSDAQLRALDGTRHWPLLFSSQVCGVREVAGFLCGLVAKKVRKRLSSGFAAA